MNPITNSIIKEIKKLHSRKHREELQLFLVEGERLVAEATNVKYYVAVQDANSQSSVGDDAHIVPHFKVLTFKSKNKICVANQPHLFTITYSLLLNKSITYTASEKTFSHLSATETPQGILAVCQIPPQPEFIDNYPQNSLILLLDNIQDPGNLGTIIRTAECAGVSAVILGKGCADLYNPKVVRSTMGAIFRLPIFTNQNLIEIIKSNPNRKSIAMSLSKNSQNFYKLDMTGQISIIIGNEANGISKEVRSASEIEAIIPMAAGESLNAAIAAAVASFEWRRQNEL